VKKHWVNFIATIHGAVLVEGDDTPEDAGKYVKRHLDISADAEGVDAEINDASITIENCYEDRPTKEAERE